MVEHDNGTGAPNEKHHNLPTLSETTLASAKIIVTNNRDYPKSRFDEKTGFSCITIVPEDGEQQLSALDEANSYYLNGLWMLASKDRVIREVGAFCILVSADRDHHDAMALASSFYNHGSYGIEMDSKISDGWMLKAESIGDLPELDRGITKGRQQLYKSWLHGNPHDWKSCFNEYSGSSFADIPPIEYSPEVLATTFSQALREINVDELEDIFLRDALLIQAAEYNHQPAQLLLAAYHRVGNGDFKQNDILSDGWLSRAKFPNANGQQIRPGDYGCYLYTPSHSQQAPDTPKEPKVESCSCQNDPPATPDDDGIEIDGQSVAPFYDIAWEASSGWMFTFQPPIGMNFTDDSLHFDLSFDRISIDQSGSTFQEIMSHIFYDGLQYIQNRNDYQAYFLGVSLVILSAHGGCPEGLLKLSQWTLSGTHFLPKSEKMSNALFDCLVEALNTRPHNVSGVDRSIPDDWMEEEGDDVPSYRISSDNWQTALAS